MHNNSIQVNCNQSVLEIFVSGGEGNINSANNKQNSKIPNNNRLKKTKPLSMNETLLSKIVKDSIPKKGLTKNNKIPNSSLNKIKLTESLITTDIIENNTAVSNKLNSKPQLKSKSKSKLSLNISSSLNNKKQALFAHNNNTENPLNVNIFNNYLNSKQVQTYSIGNDKTLSIQSNRNTLKSENSLSSMNTNTEKEDLKLTIGSNNSHANLNINSLTSTVSTAHVKSFQFDHIKLNEELLEYKLNNSKMKNEINILHEKLKTMKQVVTMKNNENELIKSKYNEMIEDYKRELEKTKKINSDYAKVQDNYQMQNSYIKSTLSVLIDLIELFISPRSVFGYNNILTRQSVTENNISASYSIDIYDSYHNDEERRYTLIEQIQGVLISKLYIMKKNLNLDIDKEIDKVKNWSLKKTNIDVDISNLKLPKFNESLESLKKDNSNDLFDLSISNQFIGQSPKFNSIESSTAINKEINNEANKENYNSFGLKKDYADHQILNDSFLKELKQNESFMDEKNNSFIPNFSTQSNQSNLNIIERIAKEKLDINIMDCSIIDLNAEGKATTNRDTKKFFNDDPTEFNVGEMNIIPDDELRIDSNRNLNTTFQMDKNEEENEEHSFRIIEEVNVPVILKPILNTNVPLNYK